MIQRIQTLWLLFAVASAAGAFALPFFQVASEGVTIRTTSALADGALTPQDNAGLLGLGVLAILTALAAIFLFKNRPLQIRLASAGVGIGILLIGLTILAINMARAELSEQAVARLGWGAALPVVYTICCWLAVRAIRRDVALVRSMDRLR